MEKIRFTFTKVKVEGVSTETGKVVIQLEALTPFDIELYREGQIYLMTLEEYYQKQKPLNELT